MKETINISKYLKDNFTGLIDDYNSIEHDYERLDSPTLLRLNSDNKTYKIFFFWWQGINNMPYIVKQCYSRIINLKFYEVIFVDRNNYLQYIDIPSYIVDLVEKKQLGLTHLSDYIRLSLLNKYGGLWLDATIFTTESLDLHQEIKLHNFFSINSYAPNHYNPSKCRWMTFCQGTNVINFPLYFLGKRIFEETILDLNNIPTYFYLDYVMYFIYENNSFVKYSVDLLNNSNYDIGFFSHNGADPFDATKFENLLSSGYIFKLTYKISLNLTSNNMLFNLLKTPIYYRKHEEKDISLLNNCFFIYNKHNKYLAVDIKAQKIIQISPNGIDNKFIMPLFFAYIPVSDRMKGILFYNYINSHIVISDFSADGIYKNSFSCDKLNYEILLNNDNTVSLKTGTGYLSCPPNSLNISISQNNYSWERLFLKAHY